MEVWSNIISLPEDPEIIKIDRIAEKLGTLPDKIHKIRELITRFEICHFKYDRHFKKITESVSKLEPVVNPGKIGENHIHKGKDALINDKTGRSKIGQLYIEALKKWLGDAPGILVSEPIKEISDKKIGKWLGAKNPEKERLVRLLIARLSWDWKRYEELQIGGEPKDLELQVCSIDICHYAIPANLNALLKGIGQLKIAENFEGCGSFDAKRQSFVKIAFSSLNDSLEGLLEAGKSDRNDLVRVWLLASLLKTLKEQVKLEQDIKIG